MATIDWAEGVGLLHPASLRGGNGNENGKKEDMRPL